MAAQLRAMTESDDLDDHDAVRLITEVRDRLLKSEPHLSSALIAETATSGDVRHDAMLGALAEEVAMPRSPGLPWASTPERFLEPWWFVSPYPAQRTIAFREAPGPLSLTFRTSWGCFGPPSWGCWVVMGCWWCRCWWGCRVGRGLGFVGR